MIVSQFHLWVIRRQRYRLLITNLEKIALRFTVRFVVGSVQTPSSELAQANRDATALDGFETTSDWRADLNARAYVASGTVEIAPRVTAAVGISGESDLPNPNFPFEIILLGHVELSCPGITEPAAQGRPALIRGAHVLLSAVSVKTHRPSGEAIEPEILIGPGLPPSRHVIEPEPPTSFTTRPAATRRAAKRRAAKRRKPARRAR